MTLGTLVAAYAKRGGRPPSRRVALAAIAALAVVEFTWLMRRRADDRVVADADAARVAGAPSRAGAARAVGAAGVAAARTRDGGGDSGGRTEHVGGASGRDSSSSSSSSSNATDGAGKRRRGSDRASVASSPPRAFASASDAIVDWWAGEGGKHPLSVSSPAAAAVGLAGCCGGQRAPSSRLATSSRVHRSVVVESRDA